MDVDEYYRGAVEVVSTLHSSEQLKIKLSKALDYDNNDELEGNHLSEWMPLVQSALKEIILSNTSPAENALTLFTEGEVMRRNATRRSTFPYKLSVFFLGLGFICGYFVFR